MTTSRTLYAFEICHSRQVHISSVLETSTDDKPSVISFSGNVTAAKSGVISVSEIVTDDKSSVILFAGDVTRRQAL